MFKILYAASNDIGAKVQLTRFLQAIEGLPIQIKIAAFKKSSPKGINVDWTLDCLLNFLRPETLTTESYNYQTFFNQVKYYRPDLVISDLEYFTSYTANVLDIPLWQCSSSLLNFGAQPNKNLGLFTNYSFLLEKNNALRTGRIINIIDNSNCNLVYSHLGDTINPPPLKDRYEWIRPYHTIGKTSVTCQHNIVAGLLGSNNKKILAFLKKQPDAVAFTDFCHERHAGLWLKDIANQEEYFCNLKNSNLFMCEGQTSFLADAFYNGKHSLILANFKDVDCVTNAVFSEHLKIGTMIYRIEDEIKPMPQPIIQPNKIKFLHQKIEDVL